MSFRSHDNCTRSICIMILGHRTRSLTTDDNISIFCCICYITNGNGACRIWIYWVNCSFLSPCMSAATDSDTIFGCCICFSTITYSSRIHSIRSCQRTNSNRITSYRLSIITYCRTTTTCSSSTRTMYRSCFHHTRH